MYQGGIFDPEKKKIIIKCYVDRGCEMYFDMKRSRHSSKRKYRNMGDHVFRKLRGTQVGRGSS